MPLESPPQASPLRALLLGGLLPVIAFTVIEEVYGTLWGLIAGMVFGVGISTPSRAWPGTKSLDHRSNFVLIEW